MSTAELAAELRLRRVNRIRTIQGSLAIEGNTLSEEQITAILEGKPVIAPPREVQEVRNALVAYDDFLAWQPAREQDLLTAHLTLMQGLIDEVGRYRSKGVGVMAGNEVVHMAPPANQVPRLMADLLAWLKTADAPALVVSSVFHYEFEFIHPFADGNGRMGRLWQTLILSQWNPLFANIPVESIVYQHQQRYYDAIQASTERSDSAVFIEFMLEMILDAIDKACAGDQVSDQVSDQVMRLIQLLEKGPQGVAAMMTALKLSHRASFRKRYLTPALELGLVDYTLPDSPNSPTQQYRLTQRGRELLAKFQR